MIRKPAIALLSALTLYSTQAFSEATITFYVVPEKVACGEQGYQGKCQSLRIADAQDWQARGYQVASYSLTQPEIIFGQPLQQALGDGRHKSVVMLVEYAKPVTHEVNLTRSSGSKHIRDRQWSHNMQQSRRFLYHERADAYLSSAATEWQLRIGDQQWKMRAH